MVPKILLLFTFDEPSSGSRTTEKRPRPTSFTWPISSDATCATSFDARSASTNRSFIQTSSSSCCSPYTLRVVAGSRRTGNSLRIRGARPATRSRRRPRSGSNPPAWWASDTAGAGRLPLLDVPSLEVVLEFFLPSVEVPPGSGKPVGEVREDLEILHALGPDVGELLVERLLPERVLPDRAAREESGGAALAPSRLTFSTLHPSRRVVSRQFPFFSYPDVSKETRRPVRPGRTNRLIAGPTPNSGSRR